MCLTRCEEFKIQKRNGKYYGYKLYVSKCNKYHSLYFRIWTGYKRRVWYENAGRTKCITALDGKTYEPGFHIFTRKRDAEEYLFSGQVHWKLKKVEFKNIVTTGYQGRFRCAIAKSVKIL